MIFLNIELQISEMYATLMNDFNETFLRKPKCALILM